MSIQKISQYLLNYGTSVRASNTDPRSSRTTPEAPPPSKASDDAAIVSADFGLSVSQAKVARLQELKSQVQSGTYQQPDADTLANAVARELFI